MRRPQTALAALILGCAVFSPALAAAEPAPSSAVPDAQLAAISPDHPNDATADVGSNSGTEMPDQAGRPAPPLTRSDGPGSYRALIETEARREGLAPEIAEAVMAVESGYNPAAIGGAGEIGLMQILPSTARMLGFVGSNTDLAVPATNIHYGVRYLAQAWRLAGADLCTAVMKYRAGHGETRFSYRSVDYCIAVRGKLTARGFHVTGVVPVATFGETGNGCRKRCIGTTGVGRVNLAALNRQLSTLVIQVRAGR
ncbi:MAG: transglycosylase SLT domain-containing protein [Xanthobacteraceae bacterium]|nr:transglycosylase SLT domain-containing protein [Xanthobacteraceae bacterium]